MTLKLYEMPHSPYCIPISQALTALEITFERVEVPNWDRSSVIRLTRGAYYQVPVLEHDGAAIYETGPNTTDVADYVDRVFADGRLFPESIDGLHEIVIEHIENELELATFKLVDPFYIDSIERLEDRAHIVRHKERKFGVGCVQRWRDEHATLRANADAMLERFDRILARDWYLFGEMPVYADFALFGIIGNLTYRGWNALSERQANLKAWVERLEAFRFSH